MPLLKDDPKRGSIKPRTFPESAREVPIMGNPGTKEGVTVRDGRLAGVWPASELFIKEARAKGAFIGVSVDPLASHSRWCPKPHAARRRLVGPVAGQ